MKKTSLIVAFFALLAVQGAAVLAMSLFAPDRDPAILSGFRGNVISGFVGGLLFLVIGLYLSDGIERLQIETHELTLQRAKRDEERQKIDGFMKFLGTEGYHDARFPDLKTPAHPIGLEYTIESVRDDAGAPRRRVTEMDVAYVVKIRCAAQEEVRTPMDLAAYEDAPIHTAEYYFCRFYNGEWHMGQDALGFGEWHAFYLSGKLGPVEHGQSANEFVGATAPTSGEELLCRFAVRKDGTLMRGSGGAYSVEIVRANAGHLYVRFDGAPLKGLHRAPDPGGGPERLSIDNMQGYFPGEARGAFMQELGKQLHRAEALRV